MARRIAAQPVELSGIRGALIVDLEAALNRLIGADSEIYDFGWERDWLAEKLRDLRAGRDVYVPGWRLPREHRPAGAEVFLAARRRAAPGRRHPFPLTPTTRAEHPILCRGQST
jgi:hypothetical protein